MLQVGYRTSHEIFNVVPDATYQILIHALRYSWSEKMPPSTTASFSQLASVCLHLSYKHICNQFVDISLRVPGAGMSYRSTVPRTYCCSTRTPHAFRHITCFTIAPWPWHHGTACIDKCTRPEWSPPRRGPLFAYAE